jgi:hypothetical protein
VLAEIGAQDVPRLRVFNKIDHVGDAAAQAERAAALRAAWPDCIVMSARRGEDVARLRAAIVGFFRQDQVEAELFLPWSAQQQRGRIFASCEVLDEERADEDGAGFPARARRSSEPRPRVAAVDVPCAKVSRIVLLSSFTAASSRHIDPRAHADGDAGLGEPRNPEPWRRIPQHAGIGVQDFFHQCKRNVDIPPGPGPGQCVSAKYAPARQG